MAPALAGKPATVGTSGNKRTPAIAAMPATAGMQARAVTPATSNSKDDNNSMTATTAGTQASAGMKETTIPTTQ